VKARLSTDGGARGNPGPAAYGYVLEAEDGTVLAAQGEAIGVAGGLLLGGAQPVVVIQCTGLFEAGDALRNAVHDLGLPLKLIVGVRSYRAYAAGQSKDNCPAFTEPVLNAWRVPYTLLPDPDELGFAAGVQELTAAPGPRALLLGE